MAIGNTLLYYSNLFVFIGVPFPKNFLSTAKTIYKRFFRVYAHIYHSHFDSIVESGEEAHLNSSFKHFMYFVMEFELIDKKELAPLQELIDKYCSSGSSKVASTY